MMMLWEKWRLLRMSVRNWWRRRNILKSNQEQSRELLGLEWIRMHPDKCLYLDQHLDYQMVAWATCHSSATPAASPAPPTATASSLPVTSTCHQSNKKKPKQSKLRSFIRNIVKLSKRIWLHRNKFIWLMCWSSCISWMMRRLMILEKPFVRYSAITETNSWFNHTQVNTAVKKKISSKISSSFAVEFRTLNWSRGATTKCPTHSSKTSSTPYHTIIKMRILR